MKNLILIYSSIIIFAFVSDTIGQDIYNARSLGLAGSNTAIAEGNEYVGGNPAVLALKQYYNFEIQLLSAHAMVHNNSYSLTEYDRYFTTGDSLTGRDIDDIFSKIPDEGWRGDVMLGARALSIYSRPFSLTAGATGNGYMNFPKDPLEFPFYGNASGEEYRIDDLEGEAWAGGSVEFGIAFPVTQWTPVEFDFFSVGLTGKYFAGLAYGNIETSEGRLITTQDYLLANARVEARRSEGGSGFGFDLGVLGVYEKVWTISFHVNNALGYINWNKNNEVEILEYQSDSLFHISGIGDLSEARMDTTLEIGDFHTSLPRKATFAVAYQYNPQLVLTAAYQQGLNEAFGNSLNPMISVGTEYLPVPVIPLRGGIALGGKYGFALGLGIGIDLKYWQLNLGYMNHNFRWFRGARSMDLALTTQFRF
ncbi:MAG: hypothetical protein EH225_09990 [Calditrichaeota bacterium]|nr:hypothetical protein [Calditrichota bacterium]RQW00951.1 MAG: hypothetical protein EH225_09990 [Calditrichota bacterium]